MVYKMLSRTKLAEHYYSLGTNRAYEDSFSYTNKTAAAMVAPKSVSELMRRAFWTKNLGAVPTKTSRNNAAGMAAIGSILGTGGALGYTTYRQQQEATKLLLASLERQAAEAAQAAANRTGNAEYLSQLAENYGNNRPIGSSLLALPGTALDFARQATPRAIDFARQATPRAIDSAGQRAGMTFKALSDPDFYKLVFKDVTEFIPNLMFGPK
jgi:hypothetical protein